MYNRQVAITLVVGSPANAGRWGNWNMIRAFLFVSALLVCIATGSATLFSQSACNNKSLFTEPRCAGDTVNADEKALFDLVTRYRAANGLPQARLSEQLSILANRRMLDLKLNQKVLTHSWSNCPYDIRDEKTWPCVMDAPKRLNTSYVGTGYETLYRTTAKVVQPTAALETWRKSTLHNSIFLNLPPFKDYPWEEIGVAIDGQFAALWFGTRSGAGSMGNEGDGLGVGFDKAVSGLGKLLPLGSSSSSIAGGKWQGTTADRSLKMEIFGVPKEISEVNIRLAIKLDSNGKLSPANRKIMLTLLGNIFPLWSEREAWLDRTQSVIAADRQASRTQIIEKNVVEVTGTVGNTLNVSIRPAGKIVPVEVF